MEFERWQEAENNSTDTTTADESSGDGFFGTLDKMGSLGLIMHGMVSVCNTVVPLLIWFFFFNQTEDTNNWDDNWTFWWDFAWKFIPTVYPMTWGPVFLMWVGIALFDSPVAAWAMSYWIYATMLGGVLGLAPAVCFFLSWTSDEGWEDKALFWWIAMLVHNFGSLGFTFLFAFPTIDYLTGEEGLALEFDEETNWQVDWFKSTKKMQDWEPVW